MPKPLFHLRHYQLELKAGAYTAWQTHRTALVVAATGTGKTQLYLDIALEQPGRVLVLAHRDYLLGGKGGPAERLYQAGFNSFGVEKAESRADAGYDRPKVVLASVQTVGPEQQAHRLARFDPMEFSLLVIDEAHRATAAVYQRVVAHFQRNPALKTLLVTATPNRTNGVSLAAVGEGGVGEAGVYGPTRAIADGYLVPLRFARREILGLDFSHVKLVATAEGKDLDPAVLARMFEEEGPIHEVLGPLSQDAGPGVVFCPSVAAAHALNAVMNDRYRPGRSMVLDARSDAADRERALGGLRDGSLDNLFQVDIATEGLDVPDLARVVWAAPTASLVKFTQGTGRVFRPHASLARHLTGDGTPADCARRRELIANSPKPFGTVITYYPQNCQHKLCDPLDVLGGDADPEVTAAAKRALAERAAGGGEPADPDEAVADAKALVNLRTLLDCRRRAVTARADFRDQEYDGFGGGGADRQAAASAGGVRAASRSAGWPAGDPPSDKQRGWFRYKGVPVPDGATRFQAVVVRDLIELGIPPVTAWAWGKPQATKVRAKLQAERGATA